MRAIAAAVLMSVWALAAQAQSPTPERLTPQVAPNGTVTASVDLAAEFPQMKGYVFTQTLTTVAPGAGRPLHSHAGSPEIVRILSGTLTDARNGVAPVAYGPGSTIINAAGVQHTWANLGSEPVVFIATAIKPAAK
jgi:quercetin dioxygenase-like cupin family protein